MIREFAHKHRRIGYVFLAIVLVVSMMPLPGSAMAEQALDYAPLTVADTDNGTVEPGDNVSDGSENVDDAGEPYDPTSQEEAEIEESIEDAEEDTLEPQQGVVNLLAVGDNLTHPHIRYCAKAVGGSKYDFSSVFKYLKSEFQSADISVINQETIFTSGNYSGFPRFGTPYAIGTAVANAGFDVVQYGNNHVMDKKSTALIKTLKWWNSKYPKVTTIGAHLSKSASQKCAIIERNGVKIAMLNFTKSTNGIKVPSKKSYLVDKLRMTTRMKTQLAYAKKHADFVVVFMHDGTEYTTSPNKNQRKHAKWFADHGVDLLIGTHPHVLQPVKYVTGKNGNRMLCYYSLGNYVANHSKPTLARIMGGMARVQIVKDETGTHINTYSLVPLVMHKGSTKAKRGYAVLKLADYTEEMAKANPFRKKIGSSLTVAKLKRKYTSITGRPITR